MKRLFAQLKENIGFIIVALLVFAGVLWAAGNVASMQNGIVHFGLVLVASVVFILVALRFFKNDGTGKTPWGAIAFTVGLFALMGVGSVARFNRVYDCLPGEQLISTNGYIPDPAAYIKFRKDCKGNKQLLDIETINYINANNRLPSWVVNDGYTADPVNWVKAHPNARPSLKDSLLQGHTRKVVD